MNYFRKLKKQWKALIILSLVLPLIIALFRIITGDISFWYDPARDLLLALSQHQKIGLIGQTSGIPGIFYGPYWVWILSIVLLFFKDPRSIAFVVLTLPYFTIFPYLLFRLRNMWGLGVSVMLWIFFALSFDKYFIHLWNPHLAPLFTLITIYFATKTKSKNKAKKDLLSAIITGFSAGVTMNLHISFGLSLVCGLAIFFLIKKNIKAVVAYGSGLFIAFLPFFIFEIRHGFNQLDALYQTLMSTNAVVLERSNANIIGLFFEQLASLLNISIPYSGILFGIGILYIIFNVYKKKIKLESREKDMLLIIGSITLMFFTIYLLTKNPVWEYHFIGVEVLFLIFIGILAGKSETIKKILLLLLALLIIQKSQNFVKELGANPFENSSLVTKQFIVDTIYSDSGGLEFGVFVFTNNPATPDYKYLLDWRGEQYPASEFKGEVRGGLVYLIIPQTAEDLKVDFIDNRTPNEVYETTASWEIVNGTIILKRELYEEN